MKEKFYIHQDFVMGIFLLLVGVFFFVGALPFAEEPGYFPKVFSVILIVLALVNTVNGVKETKKLNDQIRNGEDVKPEMTWENLKLPVCVMFILLGYAVAISILGFFVSTFIFLIGFMAFLGYRNWRTMILVALGVDIFIYVVFVMLLSQRLPSGLLL